MKKRILLTGLDKAAAVSFYNSIPRGYYEFFLGDSNPTAPGLFLVPSSHRVELRQASDENFIEHLLSVCSEKQIDVVVPMVQTEMLPIAESLPRFSEIGVKVLCETAETLRICNDKALLMETCGKPAFVPRSAIFNADLDESVFTYPVFLKPRKGTDLEGFGKISSAAELADKPRNANLMIQEFISGPELTVDVLANEYGDIISAISRARLRNDSDAVATTQTFRYERLEIYAKVVARKIGLKFVAKIHFKVDETGEPMVIGVKPFIHANIGFAVKSGVNMPLLSLRMILGSSLGDQNLSWKESSVTRMTHGNSYEFFDTKSESLRKNNPLVSNNLITNAGFRDFQNSFMFMEFSTALKNC